LWKSLSLAFGWPVSTAYNRAQPFGVPPIRLSLLPRQAFFFDKLEAQSRLIAEAASRMHALLQKPAAGALLELATDMAVRESECDKIQRAIIEELDRSFFTPLDPEDILALTNALDDIMDGLEDTAHRLSAWAITPVPPPVTELTGIVREAAAELARAVTALKAGQSAERDAHSALQLKKRASLLGRHTLVELFRDRQADPILVQKLREVYGCLEATLSACGRAAARIQHVHVKSS
jgi:uncharacterized protein Yka (UPF0111/DUF47 family)